MRMLTVASNTLALPDDRDGALHGHATLAGAPRRSGEAPSRRGSRTRVRPRAATPPPIRHSSACGAGGTSVHGRSPGVGRPWDRSPRPVDAPAARHRSIHGPPGPETWTPRASNTSPAGIPRMMRRLRKEQHALPARPRVGPSRVQSVGVSPDPATRNERRSSARRTRPRERGSRRAFRRSPSSLASDPPERSRRHRATAGTCSGSGDRDHHDGGHRDERRLATSRRREPAHVDRLVRRDPCR